MASKKSKYTIYVNRKSNIVNVVNRKGKLVRAMYCSTGVGYATIGGTYYTQDKMRWHTLAHNVYGQYCTRIHDSYLFHSVWYYTVNKNQLSYQQYNQLGKQASMGCVRLAVVDAKWIYDNCPRGTKVVIGESKSLEKPDRKKLKLPKSKNRGWDPTDPDPDNPYRPKIKLKKGSTRKIAYGSVFDPIEHITVSSKFTRKKKLIKYVKVKGQVDTSQPGEYKVKYKVTDPATFLSRSFKVTYIVEEPPAQEAVPAEAQPTEAPPAQTQPAQAQPAEVQSAQAPPAEAQPTEAPPAETPPAPAEAQPTEAPPAETPPAQPAG